MNRVFLLLAEFDTVDIPLEKVCEKYFGMNVRDATRKAKLQQLPVPTYRAGSQRSPFLISANELAAYLDKLEAKARSDHQKMNAA